MRILADYHHADLYESLELLADRFGWQVFAPYGMGWYDHGYWAFEKSFHGDAIARQYLQGVWPDVEDAGGHVTQRDSTHPGRIRKGVTIEQARSQEWDVIICSLSEWKDHLLGFDRLRRETSTHALIAQVGNVGAILNIDWSKVDGALLSTTTDGVKLPKPSLIYRQEFSLMDFRYEWPPTEPRSVASFIQCFAENKAFYDEFLSFARDLPEFDWRVYGAYGSHDPDEFACGNLPTTPDVAAAMRRTRIAWHSKWWSDGYGHVVHNLFAVGRPVVGYADYYADKLAGPLWVDGVTSYDLASHSAEEVTAELRRLRDDDEYHRLRCENAATRFREVVNFDEDAGKVRSLLESLA